MGEDDTDPTSSDKQHNHASSVVWNHLGAIGTLQNTPTAAVTKEEDYTQRALVAVNAHFSYKCHSLEECWPKSGIPREAVGDPPPTQQLVTGWITDEDMRMTWTLTCEE